jgi:hypothetical protein
LKSESGRRPPTFEFKHRLSLKPDFGAPEETPNPTDEVASLHEPDVQKLVATMPTVTIAGAIEYQACDDEISDKSTRVPISVTVTMKSLDRRRHAGLVAAAQIYCVIDAERLHWASGSAPRSATGIERTMSAASKRARS